MSARLETRALSLRKGSTYLVKNVSFSVEAGRIFGVAGRSGSGKSSLLKLLCRLEEPTEGSVFLGDGDAAALEPRELRRQVTLVFQTPTLLGPTVADDLKLGLRFSASGSAHATPDREWCEGWMRRVHLSPALLPENPKQLSVGEAQRVALARAMVIQPQFLLLDEPTSALDQASKQAIETTLQEAAAQGLGIVLVSHDLRQLQALAPKGLELANGEVIRTW